MKIAAVAADAQAVRSATSSQKTRASLRVNAMRVAKVVVAKALGPMLAASVLAAATEMLAAGGLLVEAMADPAEAATSTVAAEAVVAALAPMVADRAKLLRRRVIPNPAD